MASFAIQGGHRIEGTVSVSGNKNAAFPLIAASLLTDETVTLANVRKSTTLTRCWQFWRGWAYTCAERAAC